MIARAEPEGEEYEPADDAMERMEKSVTSCEQELLGIRTGVCWACAAADRPAGFCPSVVIHGFALSVGCSGARAMRLRP